MSDRLAIISKYISSIDGVDILGTLEIFDYTIKGRLSVQLEGAHLEFDLRIFPTYPYQLHEDESIKFINSSYIDCDHVNRDGSICIHTVHHPDIETKLKFDLEALKQWIRDYFLSSKSDSHYSHLIAQPSKIKGVDYYFLFTDINSQFIPGDYGRFSYGIVSEGPGLTGDIVTFFVKEFHPDNRRTSSQYICQWSDAYIKEKKGWSTGVFLFLKEAPTIHRRFMIENWKDLAPHVTQDFMKYLYDLTRKSSGKQRNLFPLMIGYQIPDGNVHWQTAIVDVNSMPIQSKKIIHGRGYEGTFIDTPINWSLTRNASYKSFFGRGALHPSITNKRIMIIGIGAIGSIVASTLARGGCRYIAFEDYDIKEPENVCRSEYNFHSGVRLKVDELARNLTQMSPFIDIKYSFQFSDMAKLAMQDAEFNPALKSFFDSYDIILDCSADNDVLSMLDRLNPEALVASISITNKAESLLFGTGPNIYKWVTTASESIKGDTEDLYEPIGCWSPTFKASYNDINVLVQYAIKQFNLYMVDGKVPRSFYLTTATNQGFTIKLHEF